MDRRSIPALALAAMLAATTVPAAAADWRHYVDATLGYAIDLPAGNFREVSSSPNGLSLVEDASGAELDVFGSRAAPGLTPSDLSSKVGHAEQIAQVTYRAAGKTWFVMSGFYRRDQADDEPLIFYAKFMFDARRSAFAGFEIRYPASEKRAFDAVVAHLEKSLRPPRAH